MTIRDRDAIFHTAGQRLDSNRAQAQRVLLFFLAITTALTVAVSLISVLLSDRISETGGLRNMGLRSVLSTGQNVLPLIQSAVLLGLQMGYTTMCLRISRGEPIPGDTLLGGFRRFFPLLISQLLLGLIYTGTAFMSIYAGTYLFMLLPASDRFYEILSPVLNSATVLSDAAVLDEATIAAAVQAMVPMLGISAVLFLLVFIPMHYRYRMVIYRLIDQPRPRALAALRESRFMMRRNRLALFRLDLRLWWYYLLQVLMVVVLYGDTLLALLGIFLPMSGTAAYFLFMGLSLALQWVVSWFFMNRVEVTYALAYDALLPKEQEVQPSPQPPAVPWQNQY